MTNQPMIKCPNCGHQFALDAVFQEHFEEEKRRAVAQATENARQKAEADYQRRLDDERLRINQRIKDELRNDFEAQLLEKEEQITAAQRQADDLKRKAEQGEDKLRDDYENKLREKEDQIKGIQRELENARKKAGQGSQQLQGEALEGRLYDALQHEFPSDEISEVRRGALGADILQKVCDRYGHCGTIIWEAKNTKNWSKDWIEKLKQDKSQSGADIMALVSEALPDEIPMFAQKDGVWVSAYHYAVPMAHALRETLLQVGPMRRAMNGRGDKMNEIYAYLISPEFKNHVERIVEAFLLMNSEIDKERAAMEKIWTMRRKRLQRIIGATNEMYTTLAAIIGNDMPQIDLLEPQALPAGNEE